MNARSWKVELRTDAEWVGVCVDHHRDHPVILGRGLRMEASRGVLAPSFHLFAREYFCLKALQHHRTRENDAGLFAFARKYPPCNSPLTRSFLGGG